MSVKISVTYTVKPGKHVRDTDMPLHLPGIIAALNAAVDEVANGMYPEMAFSTGTWEFATETDDNTATAQPESAHEYPRYTFPMEKRTRY